MNQKKYLIGFIVILIIAIAGAYLLGRRNSVVVDNNQNSEIEIPGNDISTTSPGNNLGQTATSTIPKPVDPYGDWKIERNTKYSYQFRYPADFTHDPEEEAVLIIPKKYFDAGGTIKEVSVIQQITLAKCKIDPQYESTTKTETIIVNGITFTRSVHTGAAAGNRYDTIQYQTYKDGLCYSISLLIHSANPGNYYSDSMQIDAAEMANKKISADLITLFEKIISSFGFIPR